MTKGKIDNFFLGIVLTLLGLGVLSFISASLGVLAKNETKFYGVLFNQLILGLGSGLLLMYFTSRIDYRFWRKYSFYFFIFAILLVLAVFIPGVGFRHGGALRWISIGPVNFQPAEFLKIAFIIYFAAWFSWIKNKVQDFKYGVLPFIVLLSIVALILFQQPDIKSFILIFITAGGVSLVAGIPWKYLGGLLAGAIVLAGILIYFMPYLADRVETFLKPGHDPSGSSYQIEQSLIAIGSGGVFGRGLGQSVQKFSYLPEPQGDSIFAVIGEEFGFVGCVFIIFLFVLFALRGLRLSSKAPDQFGRLLSAGIVILITAQAFLNIASITGVFPLTGVPLPFISHGGTSLMLALASIGIVLNISKNSNRIKKV